MLTNYEMETVVRAKEANPYHFEAIIQALKVMADRRVKYSGTFHPYYNFVDVATRTGQSAWGVLLHYIGMKMSRLSVSAKDYQDERVVDTLLDLVNYAALAAGWVIGLLKETDVIPPRKNTWEDIFPLICLDFDGLLNQYEGWTGKYEHYDPYPGVADFMQSLRGRGFFLMVCTARKDDDLWTVVDWLKEHDLYKYLVETEDAVTNRKPPAVMYLDDRALTFSGDYGKLLEDIDQFKAYWQK